MADGKFSKMTDGMKLVEVEQYLVKRHFVLTLLQPLGSFLDPREQISQGLGQSKSGTV